MTLDHLPKAHSIRFHALPHTLHAPDPKPGVRAGQCTDSNRLKRNHGNAPRSSAIIFAASSAVSSACRVLVHDGVDLLQRDEVVVLGTAVYVPAKGRCVCVCVCACSGGQQRPRRSARNALPKGASDEVVKG